MLLVAPDHLAAITGLGQAYHEAVLAGDAAAVAAVYTEDATWSSAPPGTRSIWCRLSLGRNPRGGWLVGCPFARMKARAVRVRSAISSRSI